MDKIKKAAASTKKFVADHKVGIAVFATSAVWMTLMVRSAEIHNSFLKEHDLYDKFYGLGEFEDVAA